VISGKFVIGTTALDFACFINLSTFGGYLTIAAIWK